MKQRFESDSYKVYAQLEQFLLVAANEYKVDEEGLELLRTKYKEDVNVDSLMAEMPIFYKMCEDIHIVCFDDILEMLRNDAEKLVLMANVVQIVLLLQINPATSATPERTFSLARSLKTWKRSTMLPKRFNSLAILCYHKQRTDKIDLVQVANEFVSLYPERKMAFGTFTPEDFERH